MVPNLQLALYSSRYLLILLTAIHVGASIILLLLSLPWWWLMLLLVLDGVSLIWTLRQYALLQADAAIIKLWRQADGGWRLQDKANRVWSARLCGDSIRTVCFVLLNFKIPGMWRAKTVVILPDSLDTDDFRRLRVYLQ